MRRLNLIVARLLAAFLVLVSALAPAQAGVFLQSGRFGQASAVPFSAVLLQAEFTGSNGSTSFTDVSTYGRTLTAVGNAQIQSNLLELDGSDDWVTAPDSNDWRFFDGANNVDFTIEVWDVVFDTTATPQPIISQYDIGSNQRAFLWTVQLGSLLFAASNTGSSGTFSTCVTFTWSPTPGTPYDLMVTRSGANYALYIDGSRVATGTNSINIFNSTTPLAIGGQSILQSSGSSEDLDGRMAAIRITSGYARATGASYTVPSLPLPTS